MPKPGDLAKRALRWLTERSPVTILLAGWVVFFLGSYPGYMSIDSVLQLYGVRTGDTTDYAPLMSVLWIIFEYVLAGPFPMLVLQSGLFLAGTYAILGKLLSPRAAALTACIVLLFPPVFAPMAVIWPSSLMAGALLAGTGAILTNNRRWQIAGAACFVLACSCRPEVVFALIPLALLVVPKVVWWKRAGIALALVIGVAGIARGADWAFTVVDNYDWRTRLMMADVAGTLRRAKVTDDRAIDVALTGMPRADQSFEVIKARLVAKKDALDSFPLVHGKDAIFGKLVNDDHAHALARSWKHVIVEYPGAYLIHRWAMTRAIIGLGKSFIPIYDEFGDNELMTPLHHRATPSDWQVGWKAIVRATVPIFRPLIWIVLAIAAVVLVRRRVELRALVASGLVYMLTMVFFAPAVDYRYAHWLVTTTTIGLAALIALRIGRRRDG